MNGAASRALFDAEVAKLDDRLLAARNWKIHSRAHPVLELSFCGPAPSELRLRLRCDDWNDSPPGVDLLAPNGERLHQLPQRRPGPSDIFNNGPHPSTGVPFVCMAGVREYHIHSSHTGDAWAARKALADFTLGGILTQIWRGWQRYWP